MRWDLAVPEGEDQLEQSGHAGSRLEVPDVRLDRSDQEGRTVGVVPAERGFEGVELDGVAEGGTGAVRLDVPDVRRVDPGPP